MNIKLYRPNNNYTKKENAEAAKNQSFFHENITIHRKWILIALSLEILFFAFIIYFQIIKGVPFGPYPVTNTGLIIISMLFILPMASLLFIRLRIQVDQHGFFYQTNLFDRKGHLIAATDITNYYIRSHGHKNKSDSTKGLFIELVSGKQLFFPSKNTSQLLQAMHQMIKKK